MAKFTFTEVDQVAPEFFCRGDMNSKSNARFKIVHPDLDGNTLRVEQKCSDGQWWAVAEIDSGLATIIDTPVESTHRIKCTVFGGSAFSIFYQE